jgi:hypothetical protein
VVNMKNLFRSWDGYERKGEVIACYRISLSIPHYKGTDCQDLVVEGCGVVAG